MRSHTVFASACLLATQALAAEASDHWAVLVAGSQGFWNYRHQADAAHAHSVLVQNGFPEENIILMMFDDVASDPANELPGQLFNKKDGADVYNPEAIDYRGNDVNIDNFYAVLKGDAQAASGGPVLQSNRDSKVFVFFSDHGAPGLVQMPTGRAVFADELQETIDFMYDNDLYDELVIYLEACESGSMFPNLREEQRVYAATASDAKQPSWAAYCYPDDTVNGTHLNTCLGDQFSVTWIEDAEQVDLGVQTLEQQWQIMKEKTAMSPAQRFGDLSISNEVAMEFEGIQGKMNQLVNGVLSNSSPEPTPVAADAKARTDLVSSRDVKLNYLYNNVMMNGDEQAHDALIKELNHRKFVDAVFKGAFPEEIGRDDLTVVPSDFGCLKALYTLYESHCGQFEDYSLKYVKYLVHACETQTTDFFGIM